MTVIKWRDTYNTGIEQFDKEHHKIVELVNTMFEVVRDKSSKEITEKACSDVLAYTVYHFANEEQAMKNADFPGFEEHRAEHARLKVEAEKFTAIIHDTFPEGATEFYRFLREWLVEHIQDCDHKYSPYLSKNITRSSFIDRSEKGPLNNVEANSEAVPCGR
jgi:hemerythrin-like metal-binding protein